MIVIIITIITIIIIITITIIIILACQRYALCRRHSNDIKPERIFSPTQVHGDPPGQNLVGHDKALHIKHQHTLEPRVLGGVQVVRQVAVGRRDRGLDRRAPRPPLPPLQPLDRG
jgi:hypothetical protein